MHRTLVVLLLCLVLCAELIWACPGLFGGGGGGGCCGGGGGGGCGGGCGGGGGPCGGPCGRRKREIPSSQSALTLEAPLRTDDDIACPQKIWQSTMHKLMINSTDALTAKFAIHKAMEPLGERIFVACTNHKSSFVANGDAYCGYGIPDRGLYCYVLALLA